MTRSRRSRQNAFTLVEAMLSTAIVGVLLVASTGVFGGVARNRAQQSESRVAYLLGQQLLTEIMQQPFGVATGTLGPASGQGRSAFASVDAYNGYVATPPVTRTGAVMPDYVGWTQTAAVAFADPANPNNSLDGSGLKRITVTVTAASGKPYTLVGLRSKFGPYEVAPDVQTTFVTGVNVTVQGASPAKAVYVGAHPLNITTSQ